MPKPINHSRHNEDTFYNGNSDLILNYARHYCKDTKEKIEYLNWALQKIYASPRYTEHLQEELNQIKRDFEEYVINPDKFKRLYLRTITPADGPSYKKLYFDEPEFLSSPWKEIEREIEELGPRPTKRGRNYNWDMLKPFEANPLKELWCADVKNSMNIPEQTFRDWHKNTGLKIIDLAKMNEWKNMKYKSIGKDRIFLKVSENSRIVIKKDLVKFFKYAGYLE